MVKDLVKCKEETFPMEKWWWDGISCFSSKPSNSILYHVMLPTLGCTPTHTLLTKPLPVHLHSSVLALE